MDIFETLLSWLQDNGILPAVDSCGVMPGQAGLYPLGVEMRETTKDVLGNVRRKARYTFLLRCIATVGEDAARKLLQLQDTAAKSPPELGENARFWAEKGKLTKDTGTGTGLYEIRLIAEREETL